MNYFYMELMQNLTFFLISIILILFIYLLLNGFWTSKIKHLPGPMINKLSIIPLILHQKKGIAHEWIKELHEEYGAVVVVGPNLVSILNIKNEKPNTKLIYGSYKFKKSSLYQNFEYSGENLFTTRNKSIHQQWKKVIAPGYSLHNIERMNEYLNQGNLDLIEMIKLKKNVNLYLLLKYFTFDLIGEIGFGSSFNMLKNNGHSILSWIDIHHKYTILKSFLPYLENIKKIKIWGTTAQQNIINFTKEKILNRIKIENRSDLLGCLINSNLFNLDQLVAQSTFKLIAATDTTSNTILWTFYLLNKHPQKLNKLKLQLKNLFGNEKRIIKAEEIKNLNLDYLDFCIHESMRLNPVTPFILPRVVPEEGIEVNGHQIPEGVEVGCTTYAIHRNNEIWKLADQFIPERFDPKSEFYSEDQLDSFIPFSLGPRHCLGKYMALNHTRLTLINLFIAVDLKMEDRVIEPIYEVTLKPKSLCLNVKCK